MTRIRRRLCTAMVLSLAVMAGLAATAAADGPAVASATPGQPGKATQLHWAVDGTQPPISGVIPTSLTVSTPPGFVLDTKAAAKRCSLLNARLNECPSASRIGAAVMTIHVTKPGGARDLPVSIKLYLGPHNSLMAVAFLAGVRVVPGSISGANGIQITFNPLPVPPVIPQVSYQFMGVTLDLGANRTIVHKVIRTRTRTITRNGKRQKVRRRVVVRRIKHRIDLVRAPASCSSGSWPFTATLGLPNGAPPAVLTAPVAC
ncbi:MAG TPA: hypothetical protein VFN87_14785 [Solirubrobacteraceae bacterium]|nr:hypothetical protein [Solirubrobacteraceae bacterium]